MRKLLNKPWFVGVVALAALLLGARSFFPGVHDLGLGGTSSAAPLSETEAAPGEAAPLSAGEIVKALPIPSLVRDPFAARVQAEIVEKVPEPDFVETVHLSAIWTQDGQTLVLLNDRICQGGDELGRFKIESATQEGVWLTHWKGRDFLAIGGNFTLNTPSGKFPSASASL